MGLRRLHLRTAVYRSTLPLAAVLAFCATGASAQNMGSEAQRTAGKALYDDKCAQCHGLTGAGEGPGAPFFKPAPRDFTSATFKFRSTASGELPTDADIRRSIRDGMPFTGMPPWPNLSDTQVDNLVFYLKSFAQDDFSGPYGNPEVVDVPRPLKTSPESVARGREVFVENQCIDCHGNQGRGNGDSAPTLTDKWDHHIRPADLTKRWTWRAARTPSDIYRTFTTGLDGSPMPSYEIEPAEDKWHLVNYVFSLSGDEPDYATAVTAVGGDPTDEAALEAAPVALFPIAGQVIEPGRSFFPGVLEIEVRAVYSQDEIAIDLRWHDMSAEIGGSNSPSEPVPSVADGEPTYGLDTTGAHSDAVAIQFPSEVADGGALPYLVFGDGKRSVDLWHADLATGAATVYQAKGSGNITPTDQALTVDAVYDDGQWRTVFRRPRPGDGGLMFEEGTFVPVAFTVWDGFSRERGNKRGLTSWYYLYLEPLERPSPLWPMAQRGLITLFAGLGIVFLVRRRNRKGTQYDEPLQST